MVLAQEAFRLSRHAFVALRHKAGRGLDVTHRAKLIYSKRPAAVAYALLREYRGAVFLAFQHYIYDKEQGRQHNQPYSGRHEVEQAFHRPLRRVHRVTAASFTIYPFLVHVVLLSLSLNI